MQDEGEFTLRDAFREALHKRAEEIFRAATEAGQNRGTGFGPIVIDESKPHPMAMARASVHRMDGRKEITLIEARVSTGGRRHPQGEVYTSEEKFWSDNDEYWERKLASLDIPGESAKILVVNHTMYRLGGDKRDAAGRLKPGGGFGGRLVKFRRLGMGVSGQLTERQRTDATHLSRALGPEEQTRNLWFNGPIPPSWRDRFPDNAVFSDGFDGPTVMS